jgi:hypothetical protein|tara:strand:+ start:150 stop:431 length:282 start_codon:yes stop_codon:yes gene_type:complete
MGQYQIVREEYHNEYGEGKGAKFYVKELKSFLFFWKRWNYIKHETCGWGDCYYERTHFKNVLDARDFIKNVLCTGLDRSKVTMMIMEKHDCLK